MENEKRLAMKLLRPKLGVGTKTIIALSVVFWVPIAVLAFFLFQIFQDVLHNDAVDAVKAHLKGARVVYDERVRITEGKLSQLAESPSLGKSFAAHDGRSLQSALIEIGKNNPYMEVLIAVNEDQKVLARRTGGAGDYTNIGDILSNALLTGEVKSSTELVSREFLEREDRELAKRVRDFGMAQFVVLPVRHEGKVAGAIISGMLLTGNPWLGNSVYTKFGVEMALFGGDQPEASLLQATSSLPRSSWIIGQVVPKKVADALSLGKPFYGVTDTAGALGIAAFEPVKDSRNRIIGALGVSSPAMDIDSIVLKAILKGVAFAALAGLVLSSIITFFIYTDINRPLKFLINAMDDVGRGELNIKVDLSTGDQFERLGAGFNTMVEGIRKREERLKKHNEVAKLLMSTIDLRELLERMLRIVLGVTESQMGIVYIYEESAETLVPQAHYGTKVQLKPIKKGEGFPGLAVADRKINIISPPQGMDEEVLEMGFARAVPTEAAYIPLAYQERVLGVLVLGSVNKYSEEQTSLFDYLASQISIALDNAIMHQKIQELSLTDTLTGLYNRRYLNARLEEEWARCVRHGKPLSVLLSDVDNFKSVNDTWGHDKGDDVLRTIARIVKSNVRKEDLAARYGGEEFVIVLPDTSSEDAAMIAGKILGLCRSNVFPFMGKPATLSIGVATYPEVRADNFEALIQAADQAMYRAKVSGKDQVMVSGKEADNKA